MEVNLGQAVKTLRGVDQQIRELTKTTGGDKGKNNKDTDTVELSSGGVSDTGRALLNELADQLGPLNDLIGDAAGRQQELSELFQDPNKADEVQARAQELLEGYFNVENTANRIFDFAFGFFEGGDREAFAEEMRGNIMKGFELAEKELGGLADISLETRDVINEKIDAFIDEGEESEAPQTDQQQTV